MNFDVSITVFNLPLHWSEFCLIFCLCYDSQLLYFVRYLRRTLFLEFVMIFRFSELVFVINRSNYSILFWFCIFWKLMLLYKVVFCAFLFGQMQWRRYGDFRGSQTDCQDEMRGRGGYNRSLLRMLTPSLDHWTRPFSCCFFHVYSRFLQNRLPWSNSFYFVYDNKNKACYE